MARRQPAFRTDHPRGPSVQAGGCGAAYRARDCLRKRTLRGAHPARNHGQALPPFRVGIQPRVPSRAQRVVQAISAELPNRDGMRLLGRASRLDLAGCLCRRLQRHSHFARMFRRLVGEPATRYHQRVSPRDRIGATQIDAPAQKDPIRAQIDSNDFAMRRGMLSLPSGCAGPECSSRAMAPSSPLPKKKTPSS